MERRRNFSMVPSKWRSSMRTADVLHAFSFDFSRCMYLAVLMEMTRGWAPLTPTPSTPSRDSGAVAQNATRRSRAPSAKRSMPELAGRMPVVNHWLHKMRFHLTRNAGRLEGFLVDNSTYDSNPCSANCMLNPVYDILPRGSWLVRSGVCQSADDFRWDPTSQTFCCPSPDYCCPNSETSCASPRAQLFDLLSLRQGRGAPRDVLESDWRRHFLARSARPGSQRGKPAAEYARRLNESVCPREGWYDGRKGDLKCRLVMETASVEALQAIWAAAPEWTAPWPENDDDVHMISHDDRLRRRDGDDMLA